jgi:hypothetical protein
VHRLGRLTARPPKGITLELTGEKGKCRRLLTTSLQQLFGNELLERFISLELAVLINEG